MTTTAPITLHWYERPIPTALDRIRAAHPGPISPEHRASLSELVTATSRLGEFELANRCVEELEETRLHRAALEEDLSSARQRCGDAEAMAMRAAGVSSSLARSVLNAAAALAAAACEFLVSWATLPPALDIERASVLGVTVSLAPVVAFVGIKEPVEHFLMHAGQWARRAFFAMVAAAVLWVGYAMAMARAEVTRVLAALVVGDLNVELDDRAVDQFVLVLSLVLIVLGATFLANAFRYGKPWLDRARAGWRLRSCRWHERRVAGQLRKCAAREAALRAQAASEPVLVSETWRRHAYAELAAIPDACLAADETVDRRLGLRPIPTRRSIG